MEKYIYISGNKAGLAMLASERSKGGSTHQTPPRLVLNRLRPVYVGLGKQTWLPDHLVFNLYPPVLASIACPPDSHKICVSARDLEYSFKLGHRLKQATCDIPHILQDLKTAWILTVFKHASTRSYPSSSRGPEHFRALLLSRVWSWQEGKQAIPCACSSSASRVFGCDKTWIFHLI